MKQIYQQLTSTWLMGTLLLFIAIVIGTATFIENDFGTEAAKALVYNTWWFELSFFILAINLFGNLTNYKLWSLNRLPVLVFHLAFFLIILGAAVTRHVGYEGTMHIREGATSNTILLSDGFIEVTATSENEKFRDEKTVHLSVVSPDEFSTSFFTNKGEVTIRSIGFIPQALKHTVAAEEGLPAVSLSLLGTSGMEEETLMYGEKLKVGKSTVSFGVENSTAEGFYIILRNGELMFLASDTIKSFSMNTGQETIYERNTSYQFLPGLVYQNKNIKIVLRNFLPHATIIPIPSEGGRNMALQDAIRFEIESGNVKKDLFVFGKKNSIGQVYKTTINEAEVAIRYGSKRILLPFSIHLNNFVLERYPGSNSPSSYASEVTLIDKRNNVKVNKRIFMNNIMKHDGYRFFQSSYDQDERGTVLSVNNDLLGTLITYIGYFLLSLGMMAALVAPKTRFRQLLNKTKKLSEKKKTLIGAALLLVSSSTMAFDINPPHPVSKETAARFGQLWVQDNGGRIKPLNTMNNEITRKLVKHNSFKGLSADQVMLSMLVDPEYWQQIPTITVKHEELRRALNLTGKKASFKQFFIGDGKYKIGDIVDRAIRKTPSTRNKLDQEAIKIDEQVNIFYMAQVGSFLNIFPIPDATQSPWVNPNFVTGGPSSMDSLFAKNIIREYITALRQNDLKNAEDYISAISNYQKKFASDILPGETENRVETFYNNTGIFMMLFPLFFVLGLILLLFQFITLFVPRLQFKLVMKIGFILIFAGFIAYSMGLVIRAYISGHAPWSNGYESMLYIGWVTILAGLIFFRRSPISLSVSSLFGGVVLMVAHLSWMNPEITNLVPVLKSYWLTIHVAVITASYGFLALSALLGFLNLILIALRNKRNRTDLMLTIEELTTIAEMSLTVGLYLLTIGSFLGGVWANESWGRYWGWDPKETWSAVTIIVYAFILHMRLIPGMKDIVLFNFAALVGFGSVIMTYLGVNYYLAGMHSYAKGEPVPLPTFVYYTVAIVLIVSVSAFFNDYLEKKQTGRE